MSLFAISDLHLPGGDETKPMHVFGEHWVGHFERICQDWQARVAPTDTVLIPGDLSWAMQLCHAVPDLQAIGALPGRKVIVKGNHDYWWNSITQLRDVLPDGMQAIQHGSADMGSFVVCGTRGWTFPTGEAPLSPEEQKIYQREVLRLKMALEEAVKRLDGRPLVVMMHYPPLYDMERDTAFTQLLEAYPVHTVVYGHLHGQGIRIGYNGVWNGVRYRLVSCDSLDFRLEEISLEE